MSAPDLIAYEEDLEPKAARYLRQEMFAIEYVKCNFKVDIAASKVGVAVGTARGWLREAMVSSYIDELIERRRTRLEMSLDKELIKMSEIVNLAVDKGDYRAAVAGQKAVIDAVTEKDTSGSTKGPMLQVVFGSIPGENNALPARNIAADYLEGVQEQLPSPIQVSRRADREE